MINWNAYFFSHYINPKNHFQYSILSPWCSRNAADLLFIFLTSLEQTFRSNLANSFETDLFNAGKYQTDAHWHTKGLPVLLMNLYKTLDQNFLLTSPINQLFLWFTDWSFQLYILRLYPTENPRLHSISLSQTVEETVLVSLCISRHFFLSKNARLDIPFSKSAPISFLRHLHFVYVKESFHPFGSHANSKFLHRSHPD